MTIKAYLWDKKYLIFIYLITVLFTGIVISIGESVAVSQSNGLYFIEVSMLLFAIYLAVDYIVKNRYYKKLKEISDDCYIITDKAFLLFNSHYNHH